MTDFLRKETRKISIQEGSVQPTILDGLGDMS